MRILGWVLTVLGCIWMLTGFLRLATSLTGVLPGHMGTNLAMALGTIALAALALWAGGKLRHRKTHE